MVGLAIALAVALFGFSRRSYDGIAEDKSLKIKVGMLLVAVPADERNPLQEPAAVFP